MSTFDNVDKDDLEYEINAFLEEHSIYDLLTVVNYCIESKESNYIDKINTLKGE